MKTSQRQEQTKEVVIIMGIQAAGKSTLVKSFSDKVYVRLNRDEMGGNLERLNKKLEEQIKSGDKNFVLDNTYATKESRRDVIKIAQKYGYSIRCFWVATKIEDAQYNASYRILKRYILDPVKPLFPLNEILGPNGSKLDKDPCNIPSIALYAYKKAFQEPTMDEGFSAIEKIPFVRSPYPVSYVNRAIILDYDDTVRKTKSGGKYPLKPEDIEILPNTKEVLQRYVDKGYLLLGVSNQSGIEKGDLSETQAKACFNETNRLIGFDIAYVYCPHHSFPIRCYCRKPLNGLGVYLIERYKLSPKDSIFVGDATSDKNFAARCGFAYKTPDDFFERK